MEQINNFCVNLNQKRKAQILGGFETSLVKGNEEDDLIKGKDAQIGEIRNWKSGQYIKVDKNHWSPYHPNKKSETKITAEALQSPNFNKYRQEAIAQGKTVFEAHDYAVEKSRAENTDKEVKKHEYKGIHILELNGDFTIKIPNKVSLNASSLDEAKQKVDNLDGDGDEVKKKV